MHALMNPHHLHRTLAAGLVAAVLAIVVTLAIVAGLGDLGSEHGSAGFASSAPPAALQPAMVRPMSGNPFTQGSLTHPLAIQQPLAPLGAAADRP
jgi:hypothetical protein